MMMISVIIPIYNVEKYLSRCVDSVLSQTRSDIELILINDGSNDSSGLICDEYAEKDSRIRVFHKKNEGVSSARNLGLDNAIGNYVMFVDSDDYMHFDMCEIMLSTLESNNADLVICGTEETGGYLWEPVETRDYSISDINNNFVDLLHTELLSPPWNKIFKRDKIDKLRFREDMSFGEDLMFNIKYLEKCSKVSFIKKTPYYHEKNNDMSLVVRFNRSRLLDIEKVWVSIDNYSKKKHGLYYKYLRDLVVYTRHLFKTEKYSWTEKKEILDEWYSVALIKKIHMNKYKVNYVNWMLLQLLKCQQWHLTNILVNWRKILLVS